MNKLYVTLLFTACVLNTSSIFAKSELKRDGNNMINLEKTKTYCIGRYAVEVPAEANPLNRYDQYDSFIIEVKNNASRQDFNAAIQKWRKDYSQGNRKIFEDHQIQQFGDRITKIFKSKLADKKILPYDVFGVLLHKNTLFIIEGNHSDTPKWAEDSNEALKNLIKNLRYRPDHEIPQESGQCIYQGFIKDSDRKFRHSKQKMGFDFKNYPSVVLRFESETNSKEIAQLIPRIESKLRQVGQSTSQINKHNIRKGEKKSSQLNAQEWISVEKMKGKNGISALWEHTGTPRNNKDPLISLEVNTSYSSSDNATSSLEQADALKLYEAIIKTIRKF